MKTPRYSKDIYVRHHKNLTRTLDTYSQYENVNEIYVSFDKSKNQYKLDLILDNKVHDFKFEYELQMVFERYEFDQKITNEKEIMAVIDSELSSKKQTRHILNEFKKIVLDFNGLNNDGKKINTFFIEDKQIVLNKIDKIFEGTDLKKHYISKKDKSKKRINTNLSKKLYNLIYHQLKYNNLRDINRLEKARKDYKGNIVKFVAQRMEKFKKVIEYVHTTDYSDDTQLNTQKEMLVYAIDNYYNKEGKTFGFYDPHSYSIEYLQNELEELNYKIDRYKEQYGHTDKRELFKKQLHALEVENIFIKNKLEKYLTDYEKLTKYLIENDKNFTGNSLSRFLSFLETQFNKANRSSSGIKKKMIQNLKEKYFDTRKFTEQDKYLFIVKMKAIHNFILKYKDTNTLIAQYYIFELTINNEHWKYAFNSRKDYVEHLKLIDKAEQESLELYQSHVSNTHPIETEEFQEIYSEKEMYQWLNTSFEEIKSEENISSLEDFVYFLESFKTLKNDYDHLSFHKKLMRYKGLFETIEVYGYEKTLSLIEKKLFENKCQEKESQYDIIQSNLNEEYFQEFYQKLIQYMEELSYFNPEKEMEFEDYEYFIDTLKMEIEYDSDKSKEYKDILQEIFDKLEIYE